MRAFEWAASALSISSAAEALTFYQVRSNTWVFLRFYLLFYVWRGFALFCFVLLCFSPVRVCRNRAINVNHLKHLSCQSTKQASQSRRWHVPHQATGSQASVLSEVLIQKLHGSACIVKATRDCSERLQQSEEFAWVFCASLLLLQFLPARFQKWLRCDGFDSLEPYFFPNAKWLS